jgi:hypothetical protein
MIEQSIPLQIDLFNGSLVDTRTPTQKKADAERQRPQQIDMFSQREVAQFGVRNRPVMPFSPGKLVLISEDHRTDEEIERDLLRQAQANTPDLFGSLPIVSLPNSALTFVLEPEKLTATPEQPTVTPSHLDDEDDIPVAVPDLPHTKIVAYLALVKAAEERATTLYASPVSALSESITMNLAKLDARRSGLLAEEIEAALQIGAWSGRQQLQRPQPEVETSSETRAATEIPILWTSAAAMQERRPDLAPQLARLRNDEIEALAAMVGQALEEFYWIQLNVVLSLYLDHELGLRRVVRK